MQSDPTKIELEPNSITIMDWVMIENKAETDLVMKYFVDQLMKTNSLLIMFMQLKPDGNFYAPGMVEQFPAFAARYVYEDETGVNGAWKIDKIREPKGSVRGGSIPCKYFWKEKILLRVDEIPKQFKNENTNVDNLVVV